MTRPIEEVLDGHVILNDPAQDGYAVISRDSSLALADPATVNTTELGVAGSSSYQHFIQAEYNGLLRGHHGLIQYDRMRRSDATVRKSLRLLKTPIMAARWFVEPASDSSIHRLQAKYVNDNLMYWMSIPWHQVLTEALLMLDFGYYMFEKVYTFGSDGKVRWKKLAPRHPIDVQQWEFDAEGGPNGVWMDHPNREGGRVWIPIEKLAVFSFDREANNFLGVSALRSAYQHWFFKTNLYKVDAVQKERHGIGIPVIKLPPGFSDADKKLASEMGRNLRTNEKAHIVLPPNWEVEFAELRGHVVNALESAEHHNREIMGNVMGEFINEPGAKTGTDNQWEVFAKSTRFIAQTIADTFNRFVIPELVDMNWRVKEGEYPQLRFRRIGDTTDWRTMSFAIRNFVGAKVVTPDDEMENWVREEMDLPRRDEDTSREDWEVDLEMDELEVEKMEAEIDRSEEAFDQLMNGNNDNPGQTDAIPGTPNGRVTRQTPPSATPPRANAGTDRSGR